jgi:hypothetical protein
VRCTPRTPLPAAAGDAGEPGAEPAGEGGADSSADVRVLLVVANAAAIRTRILPRLVERHRPLLARESGLADAVSHCPCI